MKVKSTTVLEIQYVDGLKTVVIKTRKPDGR
jgi:hypothetical protein